MGHKKRELSRMGDKKMKSLLIISASGYGQLIKEIAETCGYDKIDFVDDNYPDYIGKRSELDVFQGKHDGCVVTIGNPNIRADLIDGVHNLKTVAHPTAVIRSSAVVEEGCMIEANAVINAHSRIGRGTYVCTGAEMNHDASIYKCSQIDCDAVVVAGAIVSEKTKIQSCTVWNNN